MDLSVKERHYSGPELDDGYETVIDRDQMELFLLKALENYSNPIQTLVQEYVNNGKDSNREAGVPDNKMDVYVPTIDNPIFKLRDYGIGLDNEGVINVYRKLGTSTKRKGNTKSGKLAGGYGAGSKIWMRYGDSIIIRAWKDGKEITYLGHTAKSKLGSYKLLEEKDSNEPNGVEIEIALKDASDVRPFRNAIRRMFLFWKEKPNIIDGNFEWPEYKFEDENFIFTNDKQIDKLCISVDGTPYNLDKDYDSVYKSNILNKLSSLMKNDSVVLKAEIIDVDIPMNREQVSDDDNLLSFLNSVVGKIESSRKNYEDIIFSKPYKSIKELQKICDEAYRCCDSKERTIYISSIGRKLVWSKNSRSRNRNEFKMQSLTSDEFETWGYNKDQSNYRELTNEVGINNIFFQEEECTLYRLRKANNKFVYDDSLTIWTGKIDQKFVEFFDVGTYEGLFPKAGTIKGSTYYNTISSDEIHFKEYKGSGITIRMEEFKEKFPVDKPLAIYMLVKGRADFDGMEIKKNIAKDLGLDLKFMVISNRSKKMLDKEGYKYYDISTIQIDDDFIRNYAESNFSHRNLDGVLKIFVNKISSIKNIKVVNEDLLFFCNMYNKNNNKRYNIDFDCLDERQKMLYNGLIKKYNEKLDKVFDEIPVFLLDDNRRNVKVIKRIIEKCLFTNSNIISFIEEKTEQNKSEDQITDSTL